MHTCIKAKHQSIGIRIKGLRAINGYRHPGLSFRHRIKFPELN